MRVLSWLICCGLLLACRSESPGPGTVVPPTPSVAPTQAESAAPAAPQLRLNRRGPGPIQIVNWSPDGKWLATACGESCREDAKAESQRVLVFELPSLELRAELVAKIGDRPAERVEAVAFNSDSSRLALSTFEGIALFQTSDFTPLREISQMATAAFEFSPDGEYLVFCSVFGMVEIVDVVTGRTALQHRLHKGVHSRSVNYAWSKDSKTLIVEGNASLFTWTPGANKLESMGEPGSGMARIQLSADDKWLLVSELESCAASVYSMGTRKLAQKVVTATRGRSLEPDSCRARISPDGAWTAAIGADTAVHLWQNGSSSPPIVVRPAAAAEAQQSAIAFSPDSKRFLYGVGDVTGIWDIAAKRPADLKAPPAPMVAPRWLTETVIAFQEEQEVAYFDLARQARIPRPADVAEGAPSPSGKVHAVASGDLRLQRGDGVELWLRAVLEGDKRRMLMLDSRGRIAGDEALAASDVYDDNGGAKLVPRVEAKVAERFFAGE